MIADFGGDGINDGLVDKPVADDCGTALAALLQFPSDGSQQETVAPIEPDFQRQQVKSEGVQHRLDNLVMRHVVRAHRFGNHNVADPDTEVFGEVDGLSQRELPVRERSFPYFGIQRLEKQVLFHDGLRPMLGSLAAC